MSEITAGHWRATTAPWQAMGAPEEDSALDYPARRAGRAAARAGTLRAGCPYARGTRARIDWLAGWWAENNGVESDT